MKKVLVLNGSPRGKGGNTAKLVEHFLEGYKQGMEKEVEINYIQLKDKNINSCTGCFSCWSETSGECIHEDDMKDLLEQYVESDLIIWATPLYYHDMTAIMKKFMERTLPLNKPDIVEIDDIYTHPQRYDLSHHEHILISNCGFPERHNFRLLKEHMEMILGGEPEEKILTVMGELLSEKPLESRISWYLEAVEQAGREYAEERNFTSETKQTLEKPLVPVEDYVEMANASWERKRSKAEKEDEDSQSGYNFMKLMKHAFNPEAAKDLEAVIEFEFTDTEEAHHFLIDEGECKLKKGASEDFTTKIITPYETWRKISEGELDGEKALMEGEYKVEGNLDLMKRLDELFAEGEEDETSEGSTGAGEEVKKAQEEQDSILMSRRAMTFCFIPWILSWIFVEMRWSIGVLLPFLLILGLVLLKCGKKLEVTYFEKASLLYFSFITLLSAYNYGLLQNIGIEFNHFSMAAIWFISVLFQKALSIDYSRHDYPPNIVRTRLFKRINNIITLVWGGIFVIMGVSTILLKEYELMLFSPLLYLLIIVGLVFTNYFPDKYQEYVLT